MLLLLLMDIGLCQVIFLHLLRWHSCLFFCFSLLGWWMALIYSQIFKQICTRSTKPTWSQCITHTNCLICWNFVYCLRISCHWIHQEYWSVWILFLLRCLCACFWCLGKVGFWDISLGCSFQESLRELSSFSFVGLVERSNETLLEMSFPKNF